MRKQRQRRPSVDSPGAALAAARHARAIVAVAVAIIVTATIVAVAGAGPALATPQATTLGLRTSATPPSSATLSGRDIAVGGVIIAQADLSGATVKIYKREVGESTDTLVAEVPVTYNLMTGNAFRAVIPAVVHNCLVTAVWDGNADWLGSSAWVFSGVRPRLKLKVLAATRKSTRLRAEVTPEQPYYDSGIMTRPPFIAVVQCRRNGRWTPFPATPGTATLGNMSTDGESWCTYAFYHVKPGTYVLRTRFIGTDYNVPSVSRPIRMTID